MGWFAKMSLWLRRREHRFLRLRKSNEFEDVFLQLQTVFFQQFSVLSCKIVVFTMCWSTATRAASIKDRLGLALTSFHSSLETGFWNRLECTPVRRSDCQRAWWPRQTLAWGPKGPKTICLHGISFAWQAWQSPPHSLAPGCVLKVLPCGKFLLCWGNQSPATDAGMPQALLLNVQGKQMLQFGVFLIVAAMTHGNRARRKLKPHLKRADVVCVTYEEFHQTCTDNEGCLKTTSLASIFPHGRKALLLPCNLMTWDCRPTNFTM